jgi:alpha-tubulin suppressor-like RCC1 family protein
MLVAGGLDFITLSVGGDMFACGRTTDAGAAYCWGWGGSGNLGNGNPAAGIGGMISDVPLQMLGVPNIATVTTGEDFTCGLTSDGTAYCWGDDAYGELGSPGPSVMTPVLVSSVLRFTTLSTGGEGYHTCGLTADSLTYCWGENSSGQLGNPSAPGPYPAQVVGGLRFSALTAGGYHTCGITAAGVAYCWGDNTWGELGTGSGGSSSVPALVSGGLRFLSISAGYDYTCGVALTGDYCWGSNGSGQFGNGTTTGSNVPVRAGISP